MNSFEGHHEIWWVLGVDHAISAHLLTLANISDGQVTYISLLSACSLHFGVFPNKTTQTVFTKGTNDFGSFTSDGKLSVLFGIFFKKIFFAICKTIITISFKDLKVKLMSCIYVKRT